MNFISVKFIIFFTILITILLLLNNIKYNKENRISNTILLLASYLFIATANLKFCLFIIIISIIEFFIGIGINKTKKKILCTIGVLIPLFSLLFFKYFSFFTESFYKLFKLSPIEIHVLVPIGISFFTFSVISYVVDVYRGKYDACKNLIDFSLYVAFFPKLTSGPIVKFSDFSCQLKTRTINRNNIFIGLQILLFGLGKKIVLADHLSVFVNDVYSAPNMFSSGTIWLAVLSYSLQIYLDFSGYSDMAIGLSRILGFNFKRNFNMPYLSQNVTEFWKRWHISLSEWLMEYLYIPLGGSRNGKIRTFINLFITMVLGGLWHGANWTFIIWGALHGIALCIHKIYMKCSNKSRNTFIYKIISTFFTFLFVSFCWIFFRAENISNAYYIIRNMFDFNIGIKQPYLWSFVSTIIVIVVYILVIIKNPFENQLEKSLTKENFCHVMGFYPILDLKLFWNRVIFLVYVGLIIGLAYVGQNPFIYGNF